MGLMSKRAGVKQWIFQRVTNLLTVIFGVVLFVNLLNGNLSSFDSTMTLLSGGLMKVFLLVMLVLGALNSVLAGWQIAGDYGKKIGVDGGLITTVVALVSAVFFAYGATLLF